MKTSWAYFAMPDPGGSRPLSRINCRCRETDGSNARRSESPRSTGREEGIRHTWGDPVQAMNRYRRRSPYQLVLSVGDDSGKIPSFPCNRTSCTGPIPACRATNEDVSAILPTAFEPSPVRYSSSHADCTAENRLLSFHPAPRCTHRGCSIPAERSSQIPVCH